MLQEQARTLGDPTRHAIFRSIAEAGAPVGVAELNERFGFNHNAIRQHLAKLVAAELVLETPARAGGRGRPRLLYEVNPAAESRWGGTGPYERLTGLLLQIIATGDSPQVVGRRAADQFRVPAPSGDVVADMGVAMSRQGFDPEVRQLTRGGSELVLQHCPFVSAALADRQTVCELHLGIVEGLAAGSTVTVGELVANDPRQAQCKVRLRTHAEPPSDPPPGTLSIRGSSRTRRTPR